MAPSSRTDAAAPTVRFLCRVTFRQSNEEDGCFRAYVPGSGTGALRALIHFDARKYPLESHYLYAHHCDESLPYTFPNMEFSATPAGLRVGPWPGWHGLPEFPKISLRLNDQVRPVTCIPWGDELFCQAIRGMALFDSCAAGEMFCHCDDTRIRPAWADLYVCETVKVAPVPVELLPSLRGKHPRLLITQSGIRELQKKSATSHQRHWKHITGLLDSPVLPWEVSPELKILPGPERLRADDRALLSAFAALIDPSRRAAAKAPVLDFFRETEREKYEPLAIDTQAGETLFVLSLCFDWMHDDWSPDARAGMKNWLWNVAEVCWSFLGYERQDYGQARYLGCALGLLAFSFLFWEDHPRAREWASHCRGVLDHVIRMLPADGFHPHGINLWIYEYGFLLRWLELFRGCTGVDLWHTSSHWKNASTFRAAATTADGLNGLTFGDAQYRTGGDSWCHYLIAARTQSPPAQALGDTLIDGPVEGIDFRNAPPRRRVYEFLFYSADVPPKPPDQCVRFFPDGGQVFIRQSGEHPSLFTFRAGPPLGRQRYLAGEHGGGGHADPVNGSFLLYDGSPAITAPGPVQRRDTGLHNTITIDGQGQVGDSTVWLPDFFPPEFVCPAARMRQFGHTVSLSAALGPAYLPHLEVEFCRRSLWVEAGRRIIGVDEIQCKHSRSVEWNIHSPVMAVRERTERAVSFDLGGKERFLKLILFEPVDAQPDVGVAQLVPAYPNDGQRFAYLRLRVRQTHTRFIWCLLLDAEAGVPEQSGDGELILCLGNGLNLEHHDGFLIPRESHDRPS